MPLLPGRTMKRDDAFWAKVDKSGECWTWTGHTTGKGYGQVRRGGRLLYSHRHALALVGVEVGEEQVDHICHERSCVRPTHLRVATNKQNSENLAGAYSNSKSGVRGVYWDNAAKSWHACVGHNGKRYRKRFPTLQEASEWARLKRLELFTHNDADRVMA